MHVLPEQAAALAVTKMHGSREILQGKLFRIVFLYQGEHGLQPLLILLRGSYGNAFGFQGQEVFPGLQQPDQNGQFIAIFLAGIQLMDFLQSLEQWPGFRCRMRQILIAEAAVLQIGPEVFLIDDAAGKAAQQSRMNIQADIGVLLVPLVRTDLVQDAAVDENAITGLQGDFFLTNEEVRTAFLHIGELKLLMPVPVDIAQDILLQVGFVDGQGEGKGAMLCFFPLLGINGDIVYLHKSTSFQT